MVNLKRDFILKQVTLYVVLKLRICYCALHKCIDTIHKLIHILFRNTSYLSRFCLWGQSVVRNVKRITNP